MREINSGREGLIHRLFHLHRPSISLVIRDYLRPWHTPQYSIYLPHIAADVFGLENDKKIKLFVRLLHVTDMLDHADMMEIFLKQIPELDFPRVFEVFRQSHLLLTNDNERKEFVGAVRKNHNGYADRLVEYLTYFEKENSLVKAREHVHDEELRIFLALLLNAPDRKSFFSLISEIYPHTDPKDKCIEWMKKLAEEDQVSNALIDMVQQVGISKYRMIESINSIFSSADNQQEIDSALDALMSQECNTKESNAIYQQLAKLPELKVLVKN